ncbi:MAG: AbrB/MazE/SpoVT family DNA-binding domain-containing protein [Armatimonadetes bacterium]|nr:AbrB/MazE/SpoVT family DNA-binding domain-containing protein [Armatimonadota bacterium]
MSKLKKQTWCSLDEQFFGAVTVGERGQVVIPADARKKLDINPGDKLLVMGHPYGAGVVLAKIESMREFLSSFLEGLSGVERTIQDDGQE